jgi:hypothetical protein
MDWYFDWKLAGFYENQKNGRDQFHRVFWKPVGQIWIFLKIEIKNSKKTRVHFKVFGQNRIQKLEVTRPTKFVQV